MSQDASCGSWCSEDGSTERSERLEFYFIFLHQELNVVRKQTDLRLPHRQIIIMIIIKMDYVLSR